MPTYQDTYQTEDVISQVTIEAMDTSAGKEIVIDYSVIDKLTNTRINHSQSISVSAMDDLSSFNLFVSSISNTLATEEKLDSAMLFGLKVLLGLDVSHRQEDLTYRIISKEEGLYLEYRRDNFEGVGSQLLELIPSREKLANWVSIVSYFVKRLTKDVVFNH
jgi:Na+-transporting NADH:ubiquinone oxidoreductase subunit NqrE